jgi:tetratricopeptide (TPR) repeat protein/predicted Ser/Thr protein kinase
MTDNPRLRQLLDELHESHATPEEVCRSCPELLPEVRARWRAVCHVRAELDMLFPAPRVRGVGAPAMLQPSASLPQVPGYNVEAELGHGGMGVVYRAWHVRLRRSVALKMLLAGAQAQPAERERFLREAEAVAGLRHANIVQVYEAGDVDGQSYFTMELVEGGNLAQQIQGVPQPVRKAAALVATLAGAVHAAHQSGIVHRDLKPANILLTADGTPKVTDFGLARRLQGGGALTLSGIPMGTPSYMAPEQAQGQMDSAGPAVDVYALGAILYELLTGRPPFRAATAAETLQQVISQEPASPSRLNDKVPRDLEIICLKCLHKEPQRRYSTAAALADDLDRFLQGEAIAARPERAVERWVRQTRRRPALSSACAVVGLLGVALVGGTLWVRAEKAATERRRQAEQAALDHAADEDLRDMVRHLETSSWPQARAAQERATGRLAERGSAELHGRLMQGIRDLELATSLESLRLARATRLGTRVALTLSEKEYEGAFRTAGFGQVSEDATVVAERIGRSNICKALLAALDDWSSCTSDPRRQNWLLQVARRVVQLRAQPDPTGWQERARDPEVLRDKEAFGKLVEATPVNSVSIPLQLALAERLKASGADPIPFLVRIQEAHPGDFWTNLNLAEALMEKNELPGAIRFYQAAIAARPDAAVVYDNLGLALALLGHMEEADRQFRKASEIDPSLADAHRSLGIALSTLGRGNEAIDVAKPPQHFNHRVASLHAILGDELRDKGKLVEAMDRYRQAIALDPKVTAAQRGIRLILMREGRLEEACLAWKKAIDANPPEHDAWDGYAELCLFLGQEAEYRRVRRMLIERFHSVTDPNIAERTGRACLLMPTSAEEQRIAEALIGRALKAGPDEPYYQFAQGLAEYRQGRLESANSLMAGRAATVMGPAPRLVQAMVEHRQGKSADARKTLAAAISSFQWPPATDHRNDWIAGALRREAEALLIPNK